jgi:glycosyltransferase involved in cell wall biosynthesis
MERLSRPARETDVLPPKFPKRVALLTSAVLPYRIGLFEALNARISHFKVFVSEPLATELSLPGDWQVDIAVQHTLGINALWRHPHGFREPMRVLVPYDTIWQLSRYAPDIVVSGEMGLRTVQSLAYRRLHPNTRLILWGTVSEENELGRDRWRRALRRWMLPKVDAVITNGKSGARYVSRFGVAEDRICQVQQTTDLALFNQSSLDRSSEQARRLLYVGQLIHRKGVIPFLAILRRWAEAHPDQEVEFWLAGEGQLKEWVESTPRPRNLKLQLLGQIPYSKLSAAYSQAGIFVFPTLADEWAFVVNEALAAGLPVLGSVYSQAVDELVAESVNGWRFRPDHPDEMAAALERALATSPSVLSRMRGDARRLVAPLTPTHMADRMIESICRVA